MGDSLDCKPEYVLSCGEQCRVAPDPHVLRFQPNISSRKEVHPFTKIFEYGKVIFVQLHVASRIWHRRCCWFGLRRLSPGCLLRLRHCDQREPCTYQPCSKIQIHMCSVCTWVFFCFAGLDLRFLESGFIGSAHAK